MDVLKFEQDFVNNTYNSIAPKFNSTRLYIWPCVKTFINSLHDNDIIADIGCGSGRNLSVIGSKYEYQDINKKVYSIGMDICQEFIDIWIQKNLEAIIGSSLNLPIKTGFFDATMCVAVIHHIHTEKRRKDAIAELIRITKPNGKIFVTAWGYEDFDKYNKCDKKKLANIENGCNQDMLISWKQPGKHFERFYHLFVEGELESLFISCGIEKDKILSYNQRGNWVITVNY